MHQGCSDTCAEEQKLPKQASGEISSQNFHPEKCPYEAYATQIPDCCAAAAAAAAAGSDLFPIRPPTGYDTRCYDNFYRRTLYHGDTYVQESISSNMGLYQQQQQQQHQQQQCSLSQFDYEDDSQHPHKVQPPCQQVQQPRSQSKVGFTSDSSSAGQLGGVFNDSGGSVGSGFLDHNSSDPRIYCTGGYCMGDAIFSRGICSEELELDMRKHIQACTCTCNHMGYGNYMDYQTTCLTELPDVAPPCNGTIRLTTPYIEDSPSSGASSEKNHSHFHRGMGIGLINGLNGLKAFVRRKCRLLAPVFLLVIALILGGLCLPMIFQKSPATHHQRLEVIRRILSEVPLIDGHNDLPWNVRKFVHNQLEKVNLSSELDRIEPWATSHWSQTDIPRLRAGLVGAQFWSAYVPCGAAQLNAVQLSLEQIDVIRRLSEMNAQHLALVTSVKGLIEAHQAGKIASLIGVEGGHSLGNSLGVLRTYYGLGARYLTLTHTCDTSWCFYVEEKLVEERGKKLDKRFKYAKAINEIRKLHYFEPIDEIVYYDTRPESWSSGPTVVWWLRRSRDK